MIQKYCVFSNQNLFKIVNDFCRTTKTAKQKRFKNSFKYYFLSTQNLFQTVNKYCRTKASFQKGRSCQSLTNIAFCLTKAAINNASIYEYFSTNLSFLSYKFCQTVNFFSCSCSSFDELLLSTVCDCPTSFVVSFLELSKSPPSTKDEKRTTAKKTTKATFVYPVDVGFFSSLTRYFKRFVCR